MRCSWKYREEKEEKFEMVVKKKEREGKEEELEMVMKKEKKVGKKKTKNLRR